MKIPTETAEQKGAKKETRRLQALAADNERQRRRTETAQCKQATDEAITARRVEAEERMRAVFGKTFYTRPSLEKNLMSPRIITKGMPVDFRMRKSMVSQQPKKVSSLESEIPYRLSAKMITRSARSGGMSKSVVAAAAYRAAAKLRDDQYGCEHDYTRKRGVIHSEIILPEGAPAWMKNREKLWNSVSACEIRRDAQLAREIQLSIPYLLYVQDADKAIRLVRGFALHLSEVGLITDFSIHKAHTGNDERNIHAHLLLTTRRVDAGALHGFGPKVREWNSRAQLTQWRKEWERRCNSALARAGIAGRVSAESYAARGLAEIAQPKLGPYLSAKLNGVFRLIRAGSAEDGQRLLEDFAQRYERIAEYCTAKLHNLRIAELRAVDSALTALAQVPLQSAPAGPLDREDRMESVGSRDVLAQYRSKTTYTRPCSVKQGNRDTTISAVVSPTIPSPASGPKV